MQPHYRPTSVSQPAPPPVNGIQPPQQQPSVQQHVVVNIVQSPPSYRWSTMVLVFTWLLILPAMGWIGLFLLIFFFAYPWSILPLVIAGCLWGIYLVNR